MAGAARYASGVWTGTEVIIAGGFSPTVEPMGRSADAATYNPATRTLPEVGIEPAHLSQQLAVLRRAGLVTSRKEGSSVRYSLTSPHVAELLSVARLILTGVLSGQAELLDDLRASSS